MSNATITIDTSQVKDLALDFERAGRVGFGKVIAKAEALVVKETPLNKDPQSRAGGLRNSISSEIEANGSTLVGFITANATSAALPSRSATIEYPSGAEKKITLRPTKAFMYAKVVAEGRGSISPKDAKLLIIPLSAYRGTPKAIIDDGGYKFVAVRGVGPAKANDYPGRGFAKLQPLVEPIMMAELEKRLGVK
jgi:hypothetical protein